MKHVLPDPLGWLPCTITGGHEASQLFLKKKSVCSLIKSCLPLRECRDEEEKHMTTMHTQDQTIWTPQLCGLPQVKERCTPDVVSPERPGLQGTVCNDHHTTGHLRQTNKTHLNMIKHFQDLWEQDFCRDTQLSIHCPFLWAYLRKSRCRQDIVASLLIPDQQVLLCEAGSGWSAGYIWQVFL